MCDYMSDIDSLYYRKSQQEQKIKDSESKIYIAPFIPYDN